jgi:hypothetical protein
VDSDLFEECEDVIINKCIATMAQLRAVQKQTSCYNNPLISVYLHRAIENTQLVLDNFRKLQKEFYEGING